MLGQGLVRTDYDEVRCGPERKRVLRTARMGYVAVEGEQDMRSIGVTGRDSVG
jgi:hypothetical protein